MITWNQLSIHGKPIGILNVNGFYDPLMQMIDHAIEEGFISAANRSIVIVKDTPADLLDAILSYKTPEGRFSLNWEEASQLI
jgi:predicted Rossmann-fold nucleotide-binding protein